MTTAAMRGASSKVSAASRPRLQASPTPMAAANAKTAPIKTSGHGEPGSPIPPSVMAVVDVSMCVSGVLGSTLHFWEADLGLFLIIQTHSSRRDDASDGVSCVPCWRPTISGR